MPCISDRNIQNVTEQRKIPFLSPYYGTATEDVRIKLIHTSHGLIVVVDHRWTWDIDFLSFTLYEEVSPFSNEGASIFLLHS